MGTTLAPFPNTGCRNCTWNHQKSQLFSEKTTMTIRDSSITKFVEKKGRPGRGETQHLPAGSKAAPETWRLRGRKWARTRCWRYRRWTRRCRRGSWRRSRRRGPRRRSVSAAMARHQRGRRKGGRRPDGSGRGGGGRRRGGGHRRGGRRSCRRCGEGRRRRRRWGRRRRAGRWRETAEGSATFSVPFWGLSPKPNGVGEFWAITQVTYHEFGLNRNNWSNRAGLVPKIGLVFGIVNEVINLRGNYHFWNKIKLKLTVRAEKQTSMDLRLIWHRWVINLKIWFAQKN